MTNIVLFSINQITDILLLTANELLTGKREFYFCVLLLPFINDKSAESRNFAR